MEKFNRSMVREISQKVQEALSEMFKTGNFDYTVNGGSFTDDKLKLNLVGNFNDKGIAKRWAKRAYELLFKEAPATMKYAYLGLKVIYKEETRVSKPRNVRKSKTAKK